ncbi:hypothetical protein [Lachnobacterium bovis]
MGKLKPVVVYSTEDKDSLPVILATKSGSVSVQQNQKIVI